MLSLEVLGLLGTPMVRLDELDGFDRFNGCDWLDGLDESDRFDRFNGCDRLGWCDRRDLI
ncbi:MAG: hypothetical protein GDA56_03080 [Hormoscilla sp. GM7CHS1pb]|nr:hypothetical protein [Hormoscilla sp. GM7CHS1pb]